MVIGEDRFTQPVSVTLALYPDCEAVGIDSMEASDWLPVVWFGARESCNPTLWFDLTKISRQSIRQSVVGEVPAWMRSDGGAVINHAEAIKDGILDDVFRDVLCDGQDASFYRDARDLRSALIDRQEVGGA